MANPITIQIQVQSSGAQAAQQGIAGIGEASIRTTAALYILNAQLAQLGGVDRLKQILDTVDAYQQASNRLQFVSRSANEAAYAMDQLTQIAVQSRTSLDDTVASYTRLVVATEDLKVSHQEVAQAVKILQEEFVAIPGASSDARDAIQQLGVAFERGQVNARQLNVVLRSFPELFHQITTEAGVTGRGLIEQGKLNQISVEGIFKAILDGSDAVQARFDALPITISQAVTVLETRFESFIGKLGLTYGVVNRLADAIDFLGQHMKVVATVAIGGALLLAIGAVATALGLMAAAIVALPVATLTAIGVTAVAVFAGVGTAIAVGAIGLHEFTDDIRFVATTVKSYFDEIQSGYNNLPPFIRDHLADLLSATTFSAGVIVSKVKQNLPQGVQDELNGTGQSQFGQTNSPDAGRHNAADIAISDKLNELTTQASLEQLVGGGGDNSLVNNKQALLDILSKTNEQLKAEVAYNRELSQTEKNTGQVPTDQGLQDQLRAQVQLNAANTEYLKAVEAIREPQEKRNELEKVYIDLINTGIGPINDYVDALRKLNEEDQKQANTVKSGLQLGANQVLDEIGKTADGTAKIITDSFNGLQGALNKFITTGKFSLKGFLQELETDILKLTENAALSGIIQGLSSKQQGGSTGGASSGSHTSVGGSLISDASSVIGSIVGALASGGDAYPGKTYVVGEHGPEIFTPNTGGHVWSHGNGPSGGASGKAAQVHVYNIYDSEYIKSVLAHPDTDQVIINKLSRNKVTANQALA